jgi:hypothetical protein
MFPSIALLLLGTLANALGNQTTRKLNGSSVYKPLFEKHSNHTPVFINSTGQSANPLVNVLLIGDAPRLGKRDTIELPTGAW